MIFIITGPVNSGKTSTIQKLCNDFPQTTFSGIISQGICSDGIKTGYKIIDIESGNESLLATTEPMDTGIRTARYYFYPKGFQFGEDILFNIKDKKNVIIDEIGKLELNKKGFYDPLKYLIENFKGNMVLVVRDFLVQEVINFFNIKEYIIINIKQKEYNEIYDLLKMDIYGKH